MSIKTLNQHLDRYSIDILINTWSTLDWHLINSQLMVNTTVDAFSIYDHSSLLQSTVFYQADISLRYKLGTGPQVVCLTETLLCPFKCSSFLISFICTIGERPYHCKHCEKSFATTISLKTHTYIHTGEKPHKCPHCPKTFATSSKLGRHIVTHSEQRPFACDHCPKSFNRSG